MRFQFFDRTHLRLSIGCASMLFSLIAWADDLTDSDSLICYGWSAASCDSQDGCSTVQPWELNLPDFIKLDLRAKLATTTTAGPEQRETEIETVERNDGMILLQGRQQQRAFSWLITEATGEGTLTVSTPTRGLTVFTLCTPTEGL